MEDDKILTFREDFPPVDRRAWREVVERDLKGAPFEKRLVSHTDDGLRVEPLYTQAEAVDPLELGYPGFPPFIRGGRLVASRWQVEERIDDADLAAAARHARDALARGATALWIRLDARGRAGRDWDHVDDLPPATAAGTMITRLEDLETLLEGIDLNRVALSLDAGAAALPLAALLFGLARKREIAWSDLHGALDADPLGALAADGWLANSPDVAFRQMAELAAWSVENAPNVRAATISTLPYHAAGASPVQELAIALATGLEYLRRLEGAGLTVAQAASQLRFRFAVGRDVFAEIAKLRAARLCWARIIEACGEAVEGSPMVIHACTAWRTKTRVDPWVNLLRATVEGFAAAVGGAESITVSPFDEAVGASDELALRIARNTQTILSDEAHVGRVMDPAGGSWYVEAHTRKLAEAAWSLFQELERNGGVLAALESGQLQRRLAEAAERRDQAISRRKLPITGVSEFPHVHEQPLDRRGPDLVALREQAQRALARQLEVVDQDRATLPIRALSPSHEPSGDPAAARARRAGSRAAAAIDAALAGATLGRIASTLAEGRTDPFRLAKPFQSRRDAEGFERLRAASDAFADVRGSRPKAFLASLGPIPQHRARAEFSANLLQAGGFEPLGNDGFASVEEVARAFAESGAQLAVICSTDEDYRARATEVARALKAAGARLVVLAGRPGEEEARYREAGVDHFVFLGCDVRGVLALLLEQLEVIR